MKPLLPKPPGVSDEVHGAANALDKDLGVGVAGLKTADYTKPALPCDVILKGGVTSGIVYPTALCRLAQDFRLKRIGGTSVGALAAAAAAAAELGRTAPGGGFGAFATLSEELSTANNLRDLFVPSKSLRPLFKVFLSAVQPRPPWQLLLIVFGTAALHFWAITLAGAVVTLALVTYLLRRHAALALDVETAVICGGVFTAVLAWRVYGYLTGRLPREGFGICSGSRARTGRRASRAAGGANAQPERAPLIEFLADRLNQYAGRGLVSQGTAAITFRDLWHGPNAPDLLSASDNVVDLQMMTTNVTLGRPHRIPFDPQDEFAFYFDLEEFEEIFPARIVSQMAAATLPAPLYVLRALRAQGIAPRTLRRFPAARDLPLVVAARMSMSFPLLFRTIPIYVEDCAPNASRRRPVRRCLLSDGGLTSNMPLHFFDGPYPRWPTFAVDLRGVPQELKKVPNPKPGDFAFMADEHTPDFADIGGGAGGIVSFALAIIGTMQNWNDSVMMRVPGYADRTVQIALSSTEGGVNLNMLPEVRALLAQRGLLAGETIDGRFAPGGQNNVDWLRHRVKRAHSFLAMAEQLGEDYTTELAHGFAPGPPQPQLNAMLPTPAPAYAAALAAAFATALPSSPIAKAAPKPRPELHTRPKL